MINCIIILLMIRILILTSTCIWTLTTLLLDIRWTKTRLDIYVWLVWYREQCARHHCTVRTVLIILLNTYWTLKKCVTCPFFEISIDNCQLKVVMISRVLWYIMNEVVTFNFLSRSRKRECPHCLPVSGLILPLHYVSLTLTGDPFLMRQRLLRKNVIPVVVRESADQFLEIDFRSFLCLDPSDMKSRIVSRIQTYVLEDPIIRKHNWMFHLFESSLIRCP